MASPHSSSQGTSYRRVLTRMFKVYIIIWESRHGGVLLGDSVMRKVL